MLSKDEVNKRFSKYNLILLDTYQGCDIKVKVKCKCGIIFIMEPRYIFSGNTKSCGCRQSKSSSERMSKYLSTHKGKNHPRYNKNLSKKDRLKRWNMWKYKVWSKNILSRDNYTCRICGLYGCELNAHHLDGYHWCKKRRFDLDNGITLCKSCHDDFHKKYGKENNTKQQFQEYLENLKKNPESVSMK